MKKNSQTLKIAQEYSEYSYIAGLVYISMKGQSNIGKCFWVSVILTMIGLSLYWSISIYEDWTSRPVITTVKTTVLPIGEIKFPSVTICTLVWTITFSELLLLS